jgi:hypoxanthine phosphoribosyltransferase
MNKIQKWDFFMIEKIYISAQQLLQDSFHLGMKIFQSGFKPDFIIGIWRGGTPVGIAIQELLDFFKINTDHIAIRTSAYTGIKQQSKKIRVYGLNYIIENINYEDNLLIVDDCHETGLSIKAVVDTLKKLARKNTPHDIRDAVVYYKPTLSKTTHVPDYYIHETDKWLIFPHELKGLTEKEILRNKPFLKKILQEYQNENNNM